MYTPDILLFMVASWFDGTPAGEKANEISAAYDETIPNPVSLVKYTSTLINVGHTAYFYLRGFSLITTSGRPDSRFLRYTRPRRGRKVSHWSMSIRFLTITSDSGHLQHHLTVLRTFQVSMTLQLSTLMIRLWILAKVTNLLTLQTKHLQVDLLTPLVHPRLQRPNQLRRRHSIT